MASTWKNMSDFVTDMLCSLVPESSLYRYDWGDVLAVKAARQVLRNAEYPDDKTRRSLYAAWLKEYASIECSKGFDNLMLDCIAATPSLSEPGKPLFGDIFKVDDPIDTTPPRGPVLNPESLPRLFARNPEEIEPLPSSPAFVEYLAGLIRKCQTSRTALDEAGMIISFTSLALCLVVPKPIIDVQEFFRTRMKKALTASVPTLFDGDIGPPNSCFLYMLHCYCTHGVVKPYIVPLILGQYVYHMNAKEAAPSADLRFLEEGFLSHAKFGRLEVIELLYDAKEKAGLSAVRINQMIRKGGGGKSVLLSCDRVNVYLRGAEESAQRTRPWCRVANDGFYGDLELETNQDYALRLTAFLAPDPNALLWHREEFQGVSRQRHKQARLWAKDFRRAIKQSPPEEDMDAVQ